jgi:hypothetical protein
MGLSFTIAAGPRQRSHSQVRVPRESIQPSVSDWTLPQSGRSGSSIDIPQEQRGPVISPGTLLSMLNRAQGTFKIYFHILYSVRKKTQRSEAVSLVPLQVYNIVAEKLKKE